MLDNTIIQTYLAAPPRQAVVLFDGDRMDQWTDRQGNPACWEVSSNIVEVRPGCGDIRTKKRFDDFYMHLEFRCPKMDHAVGQQKGNSGVYLQGRYELQILDSFGVETPGKRDCGAVYGQTAPLVNACKPPMVWQTFDVFFRSARRFDSHISAARLTAIQNGQIIHNNVGLQGVTGQALDDLEGEPGPLMLQDHGDPVAFRNCWVVPL